MKQQIFFSGQFSLGCFNSLNSYILLLKKWVGNLVLCVGRLWLWCEDLFTANKPYPHHIVDCILNVMISHGSMLTELSLVALTWGAGFLHCCTYITLGLESSRDSIGVEVPKDSHIWLTVEACDGWKLEVDSL